jgi:hypothetical protein
VGQWVRQATGKRKRQRGEVEAPCLRRIRRDTPAGAAEFDKRLVQPGGTTRVEKERGEGGGVGLLIGVVILQNKLGFGEIRGTGETPCRRRGSWCEVEDDMWGEVLSGRGGADERGPDISGWKGRRRTPSG